MHPTATSASGFYVCILLSYLHSWFFDHNDDTCFIQLYFSKEVQEKVTIEIGYKMDDG